MMLGIFKPIFNGKVYEVTATVTHILMESENMTNVVIEAEGNKHFVQLTSSVDVGETIIVRIDVPSKDVGESLSFNHTNYHPLINPNTDIHYIVIKRGVGD